MKNCENCGIEHEGKYGSGRFCSTKCSRGFSTKNKREYINRKIGTKNRLSFSRICYCKSCGIVIHQQRKSREIIYCEVCTKLSRYELLFNKLDITGSNLKIIDEIAFELLYKLYFKEKWSKIMIFEKFNIRSNTLYNYFKNHNVKLRDLSEAAIIALENNRTNLSENVNNVYQNGYHVTWNGKKVFLRSSYEYHLAKKLDEEQIDYEVESLRIKYYDSEQKRTRIAIPDFYIPEDNTIIEVKSTYTLNENLLKDKFKAYKKLGYKTKLILNKVETNF